MNPKDLKKYVLQLYNTTVLGRRASRTHIAQVLGVSVHRVNKILYERRALQEQAIVPEEIRELTEAWEAADTDEERADVVLAYLYSKPLGVQLSTFSHLFPPLETLGRVLFLLSKTLRANFSTREGGKWRAT